MGRRKKRPVTGAGTRLKAEIDRAGIDVKPFQEAMHAAGIEGSAYSSVWSYLTGRTEPPLEFLQAAAKHLGLRVEYLQTGTPPRTVEDKAAEEEATESRGPNDGELLAAVRAGLRDAMPEIDRLPFAAKSPIAWAWSKLANIDASLARANERDPTDPRDIARTVAECVAAPARILGTDLTTVRSPALAELYVRSMCEAIVHLAYSSGELSFVVWESEVVDLDNPPKE